MHVFKYCLHRKEGGEMFSKKMGKERQGCREHIHHKSAIAAIEANALIHLQ